jgi:hypothetical protein
MRMPAPVDCGWDSTGDTPTGPQTSRSVLLPGDLVRNASEPNPSATIKSRVLKTNGQRKEYFGYNYITDPQDMAGAIYDYVVITLGHQPAAFNKLPLSSI